MIETTTQNVMEERVTTPLQPSAIFSYAKTLIPSRIRATGSRVLAERTYHRFLKRTFRRAYRRIDHGSTPSPDIVIKTNAKTKAAFQRSFGNSQIGQNIYLTTGYNNAHLFLRRLGSVDNKDSHAMRKVIQAFF